MNKAVTKQPDTSRAFTTDVVVCGGGAAGIMAALGAAREGVRVTLIEQEGCLGGNLTTGLVNPMLTFHAQDGTQVIRGLAAELVEHLVSAGGSPGHVPDPIGFVRTVTPFHPEYFKHVAEEMLLAAGVELVYHTAVSGVEKSAAGRLAGVTAYGTCGWQTWRGRVFIDATGNGDLLAAAGEDWALGRPEDGLAQPMTLMFHIGGVEWPEIYSYVQAHPEDFYSAAGDQQPPWPGIAGFYSLVRAAVAREELPAVRDRLLLFGTGRPGEAIANVTRIIDCDPLSANGLTRAEIAGRRQMWQFIQFMQRRVPGMDHVYLIQAAARIAVRESRRLQGRYVLQEDDLISGRPFADTIAHGSYPIDIHSPAGSELHCQYPETPYYNIPLRCLLARRNDNLLVAGRCLSATHGALAAVRVSPIAMAVGEATGRAAALAVRLRFQPGEVPIGQLQARLALMV